MKGCACKDCQAKFGMPDELKAKLSKLEVDKVWAEEEHIYARLSPAAIAQINQAYKDDGYERRGYHTVKRPGEDAQLLMTARSGTSGLRKSSSLSKCQR